MVGYWKRLDKVSCKWCLSDDEISSFVTQFNPSSSSKTDIHSVSSSPSKANLVEKISSIPHLIPIATNTNVQSPLRDAILLLKRVFSKDITVIENALQKVLEDED